MALSTFILSGCACLALLLVILAITAHSIPLGGYTWKVFERLNDVSWSVSAEEVWTINTSFVEYDATKSFLFWLVAVSIVLGIVVLACVLCAVFGMVMEGLICSPCTVVACLCRHACFVEERSKRKGKKTRMDDSNSDTDSDIEIGGNGNESIGYDEL